MLEFDIKGLFDAIDHRLLMRAVEKHTDCRWVRLYIERWLKAPFQQADGELVERVSGTPQGGVVSPLLANLFLHYVFDKWMERNFPSYPFCRYADDGVVHCRSEAQARELKERLEGRFRECKLALHPEKTQIVCCRVGERQNPQVSKTFDFLGYCFRPRLVRNRHGKMFVGFTPAISPRSAKRIRQQVRRCRLHLRTSQSLDDLACADNAVIRGWVNYYGAYQRSSLHPVRRHIDRHLVKWVKWKYKKKGQYTKRARRWLGQVAKYQPELFAPFPAE